MLNKRTHGQARHTIPRSRYLLFLGALLNTPLAFVPWITAKISFLYPGRFGATSVLRSYNPIQIYDRLLGVPAYLTAVDLIMVGGCCIPGLLFSVWLRERIQSPMQQLGAALYSIWLLLLTGAANYAVFGMLYDSLIFQRMLWIQQVWSWQADSGLFVWVLTQFLLWIGLVALWREMPHSPKQHVASMFRRPYTLRDGGMALVALGGVCWFTGYYGLYWYLPDSCHAAPLFGFAPCTNRLDTAIGFVSTFNRFVAPSLLVSRAIYWGLGGAVVLGGIGLFVYHSVRQSTAIPLPWALMCIAGIILLTGTSFVGIVHLAAIYPDERMTFGLPLTSLGGVLLISGLVIRWRSPSPEARTESQ